ncbi:hypothetical protein H6F56_10040 [Microcoleus sp. FACHB-672]|nr:hypothetical protein [Microcoleus sp. FACHB-672]
MFDLNTVSEFSRNHCISICAFLVPANLVATLATIVLTALRRPKAQVWKAAAIAAIPALVMVFHVITWFMIGVVMAPTYILLWLAATCLSINLWAISHPQSMVRLLKWAWGMISPAFQRRHLT